MTTPQTSSSNTPNPDAALLVGGPADLHGKEMPKTGEPHPESRQQEKVKYELNGKSFDSAEDMSKYVADLEKKVIDQPTQTVQQVVNPPMQSPKVLIDGLTLDQLMFANPERYTQYIQEQADKRVEQRLQVQENKKQFWSEFYTNNPDLRGKEEIVDALVAKNWVTWEKLQVKDFAKAVSDTSRSTLKKVGAFNATEVKPGEAAALSASGSTPAPVERPPQITNFVEEMKLRNSKRLKSKTR